MTVVVTATKKQRDAALAFANRVRKTVGKKPVKKLQPGIQRHATCCPIARTIDRHGAFGIANYKEGTVDFRVEAHGLRGEETTKIIGGRVAAEFVQAFDEGAFPDLILEPKP